MRNRDAQRARTSLQRIIRIMQNGTCFARPRVYLNSLPALPTAHTAVPRAVLMAGSWQTTIHPE